MPVSIHRHNSVHKILQKPVSMRSIVPHLYFCGVYFFLHFCSSISLQTFVHAKFSASAAALCSKQVLPAFRHSPCYIHVGIPVSHGTASLLQADQLSTSGQ